MDSSQEVPPSEWPTAGILGPDLVFSLSPSLPTSVAFIAYLSPFRCKFAACRTRGRRSSRVTAPGRCPPSTAGAEGDLTRPDGAPIRTRRYILLALALYKRPIGKEVSLSDDQLQREQRLAARSAGSVAERRRQRPHGLEGQIPQVKKKT